MQMPVPGPEHQRLFQALAGDFTSVETMWPSPYMAQATTRHGRTHNRVGVGGLFLINDYEQLTDGNVTFQGHGLYGFDPKTQRYSMQWFDAESFTGGETIWGTWPDATLTFESPGRARYAYQVLDENSYEFRILLATGTDWTPLMTSTFRRVGA